MLCFFMILFIAAFLIWQDNDIITTRIDYANADLPDGFDGYTLVHISDLHNKSFGENSARLIEDTRLARPDAILITGDLINRKRTDIKAALVYIRGAVSIAPVYFAPGNHEALSGAYPEIRAELVKAGVTVLDGDTAVIEKNGQSLTLIGVRDLAFFYIESDKPREKDCTPMFEESLRLLTQDYDDRFTILLSHRPHLMELYADCGIDLVLSGHAHGGQICIPFVGAIIAPDQGFFPKYTSGLHTLGGTSMVISRGLGNSTFPLRVFNRPELVVVTLKKA